MCALCLQRLSIRGGGAGGNEERHSADQRAEEEAGEHRQDCTVAGLRSGLGGALVHTFSLDFSTSRFLTQFLFFFGIVFYR